MLPRLFIATGAPPCAEYPSVEYNMSETDVGKVFDVLHRVYNWNTRQVTRTNIKAYLTADNLNWKNEDLVDLERTMTNFFQFLTCKNIITMDEYNQIKKRGGFRYAVEIAVARVISIIPR
jgi:hypothetical protein